MHDSNSKVGSQPLHNVGHTAIIQVVHYADALLLGYNGNGLLQFGLDVGQHAIFSFSKKLLCLDAELGVGLQHYLKFVLALIQDGLGEVLLPLHKLLKLTLKVILALLGLSLILRLERFQTFLHGKVLRHARQYEIAVDLSHYERPRALLWNLRMSHGVGPDTILNLCTGSLSPCNYSYKAAYLDKRK